MSTFVVSNRNIVIPSPDGCQSVRLPRGFMGAVPDWAAKTDYASYVNDGHRVDKHFVPGLYIDPATGLLSMDPAKPKGVGLMVGAKTTHVEGLHITEAAEDMYQKVAEAELHELTREVFR